MDQKLKLTVLTAITTLALAGWFSNAFALLNPTANFYLQLSSAVLALCTIAYSATKTLLRRIFGIDVLATVAIAASIASGEFLPAAVVALMLFGGEILEDYAQQRASRAIQKLIETRPQTATAIRNGQEVQVKPEDVELGETVLVKPGAKIPVDGIIQEGHATLNQASVTGESTPAEKCEGDTVYSGTTIQQGAIYITATAVGERSTYGRIIALVKEAEEKQAPIERTADKYARYFTPTILILGLFIFALTRDILRLASVFVIACPCALTLATPTAIIASMGNAARKGILIRNGESLEKLANADALVLDKTGTITKGILEVVDIKSFSKYTNAQILQLAATAEKCSEHPFAKAILEKARQENLDPISPECFEHHPGLGVRVAGSNGSITVGNERFLQKYEIPITCQAQNYVEKQKTQTTVFVAEEETIVGALSLADQPRENVRNMIAEVKKNGVKVTMLTGDNADVANAIAEISGIDEAVSNMMPADKVHQIRKLRSEGHIVAMVGDGINDAPALAEADVGIAMGLSGTDVAMETAGITLATDDLSRLPKLLRISRRTFRVIKQNIAFALAVNIIGIILSTQGWIPPLTASIIHESNALIVMANSLRLLRVN
jgi:Cd2+/Zn2+-exporting ATPase